jgi:hypothetical protein
MTYFYLFADNKIYSHKVTVRDDHVTRLPFLSGERITGYQISVLSVRSTARHANTCSSILTLMLLKQELCIVQSVLFDVWSTVRKS